MSSSSVAKPVGGYPMATLATNSVGKLAEDLDDLVVCFYNLTMVNDKMTGKNSKTHAEK